MNAVFVVISQEVDALTVLSSPLPLTNEEWATRKILLQKDVPDAIISDIWLFRRRE